MTVHRYQLGSKYAIRIPWDPEIAIQEYIGIANPETGEVILKEMEIALPLQQKKHACFELLALTADKKEWVGFTIGKQHPVKAKEFTRTVAPFFLGTDLPSMTKMKLLDKVEKEVNQSIQQSHAERFADFMISSHDDDDEEIPYSQKKMREKFTAEAVFREQPNTVDAKKKNKFSGIAAYMVDSVDELGEQLGRVNEIPALENIFEFNKIIMGAVDCLYIAGLLVKAQFKGEPLPFKLSKLGRFFYSAAVLGLSIAALVASQAVVPTLLLILASTVFAGSALTLARLIYKQRNLSHDLKKTEQELLEELKRMSSIQDELKQSASMNQEKIDELSKTFEKIKNNIIELKHTKATLQEANKKLNTMRIVDKLVSVNVGILSVLGFGLALAFPYVGATIVTVAMITGATYALARITPILLTTGFNACKVLFNKIDFLRKKEIHERNESTQDNLYKATIELQELPIVKPNPLNCSGLFSPPAANNPENQDEDEDESEGDSPHHSNH